MKKKRSISVSAYDVMVDVDVDIDIDDYKTDFFDALEDYELVNELNRRGIGNECSSNEGLIINRSDMFIGKDKFKRFLCNLLDLNYNTSKDKILKEIEERI